MEAKRKTKFIIWRRFVSPQESRGSKVVGCESNANLREAKLKSQTGAKIQPKFLSREDIYLPLQYM